MTGFGAALAALGTREEVDEAERPSHAWAGLGTSTTAAEPGRRRDPVGGQGK